MISLGKNLLVVLSGISYQGVPVATRLPRTRILPLARLLLLNLLKTISLLLMKTYSALNVDDALINLVAIYKVIDCEHMVVWIIHAVLSLYLVL
jgi:hypothetical protein